jgi:hypothetical protein
MVESHDSYSYMAAVGISATALSHAASCPAVAVGHEPIAEARKSGGRAVSVGSDPMAMAGPDGYLIFVDTASKTPTAAVFKVGEFGIKPNTLYFYSTELGFPQEISAEDLERYAVLPGSTRWKDLRRSAIQRDLGGIVADS